MEQLQVVWAHLKVHRFWYLLGLAVLFASLVSMGTSYLHAETSKGASALESSWKSINEYTSGARANSEWKRDVDERKGVLDQDYGKSQEGLYLAQEKLFVWPVEVAEKFKGRPFGAALDEDQNKYIFEYRRACDRLREIARVFWDLNVLGKDEDGKLIGIVDVGPNPVAALTTTVKFPTWSVDPTSLQAWLAQEQLWIQHAVIRSIRAINKPTEDSFDVTAKDYDGTKPWIMAPIKRVHRIEIGSAALAQPFLGGSVKELLEYQTGDQQASNSSAQSSGPANLETKRYIEKNDQYRLIPVSVHLLVDQAKIAEVLGGLANTDFNFTILEVRQTYPQEKVPLPALLERAGVSLPGRGADNPLYNCMDLDVYGTMRIYEMPVALREKRGHGKPGEKPADGAKPADAPPPAAAAPPTPAPEAPKTDAKPAPEKKADDQPAPEKKADEKANDAKSAPPPAAKPEPKPEAKSEPKTEPKSEPKKADDAGKGKPPAEKSGEAPKKT